MAEAQGTHQSEVSPAQARRIERAQALARWNAACEPLSNFVTRQTLDGLSSLTWDFVHDIPLLMWEVHHDGSRRLDFSLTEQPRSGARSPLLIPAIGMEYDFLDDGPVFMGHFVMTRAKSVTNAHRFTQNALISAGSDVDLEANHAVAQLIDALGVPHFIGVTSRGSGTRLVINITQGETWQRAHAVLRAHGLPDEALMPTRMAGGLLDQGIALDLSIDVAGDRISHRAAMKLRALEMTDHKERAITQALATLGVPGSALQEAQPFLVMPGMHAPLDSLDAPATESPVTLRTSHVKVDLSTDPPTLKSYLACTSLNV